MPAPYRINFELRTGNANVNTLTVDITGVVPANTRVYIKITKPDGTVRDFNMSTPDIDQSVPNLTFTEGLSLASDGTVLKGTYHFEFRRNDPTMSADSFVEQRFSYYFCPKKESKLKFEYNCICGVAKLTDITEYGLIKTINSINQKLIHPVGPDLPTVADTINTDVAVSVIAINFTWAGVTYTGFHEVDVTMEPQPGIIQSEILKSQTSSRVECDYNICRIISCIEKELLDINNSVKLKGGFTNLTKSEIDRWFNIDKNIKLHEQFLRCGNYDKAHEYYTILKNLIDCDCGCAEDLSGQPYQFTPSCSIIAGTGANITATDPVVSSFTGGQWVIGLTPAFVASVSNLTSQVAALLTYDVQSESGDTTMNVSASTFGSIRTHTIKTNNTDWTVLLDTDMSTGYITEGVGFDMKYRFTATRHLEITGTFRNTGGTVPCVTVPFIAPTLNITQVYAAAFTNGIQVGIVSTFLVATPNGYSLYFTGNADYVSGQDVSFHILIPTD